MVNIARLSLLIFSETKLLKSKVELLRVMLGYAHYLVVDRVGLGAVLFCCGRIV